ncbi:MAG: zinc transporter ZupT [Bacteroidetes bacterium HGW-Bacteroidetes-4]|jgi:ZIP family zinc transporter|nr:MAG: zinc transporter ZupT [Bacteroidetes bacterium HGW-Bacteroidetes-4]
MNTENVLFAFALTLFAGLSTGIGSALAFFTKRTNTRFLTYSLGFSAGVMIYVSLVEIFQKSVHSFAEIYSPKASYAFTLLAFFGGIAFIALIDMLIPSYENPHEIRSIEEIDKAEYKIEKNKKLARMGLFSALAIAIHNFPEGIATFAAGLANPEVAIPIAFAIAIHNIPEGIAVSVPIYYATGNRRKAFLLSFLSGLAEPVGALVGFVFIYFIAGGMTPIISGVMFGTVAGIMVFISLDELLPTAEEYGEHHISIYGLVSGMAIMAVSLLLFM